MSLENINKEVDKDISPAKQLQNLKNIRKGSRSKFTRNANYILKNVDEEEDCNVLSDNLEELREKFLNLNDMELKIADLAADNYSEVDAERSQSYHEKFASVQDAVNTRIHALENFDPRNNNGSVVNQNGATSPNNTNNQNAATSNSVLSQQDFKDFLLAIQSNAVSQKIPEVPLPTFNSDNKDSDLTSFILEMEEFFDKNKIDVSKKFPYLRGQLKGKALKLIDGLPFNQRNYDSAKDILQAAFASELKEKHGIIKSLTEIKYVNSIEFYGELNKLHKKFQFSKIEIEDVLQYFPWCSLPAGVRSNLVNITGQAHPSLDDILKNIFNAQFRVDEYTALKKESFKKPPQPTKKKTFTTSKKEETSTLAINVKPKPEEEKTQESKKSVKKPKPKKSKKKKNAPFCSLCHKDSQDSNHKLEDCQVYKTPNDCMQ